MTITFGPTGRTYTLTAESQIPAAILALTRTEPTQTVDLDAENRRLALIWQQEQREQAGTLRLVSAR